MDPQDFGFPDPQKYPNPRGKISIKNCKKKPYLLLKPKTELLIKRRDYKNFLISEWMKFQDKNMRKKKFENYFLFKRFSISYRNDLDPNPDPFFPSADPGSGSASKLNGS